MGKFDTKYGVQISSLLEGVTFQAERRNLFLLDDGVFSALLEEGMQDAEPNVDDENGEKFYERRILCIAVVQTSIAMTTKTESELIDALCTGSYLMGFLAGMPESRTACICPACIIKNHQSGNGMKGADKRHAPMRELEKWTVEQREIGDVRTANKAAHEMKNAVIQYGKTIGATLSDENAQRTIAEWLRKPAKLSV
ncbi:hypothetical protein RCH09_002894 [Actimicrobium sp. GrIS 1.19]|uniref:hypothetical protein n=1 Tax=Actimicrobium sp. GrIS 1.19 TaxID=3071708 RepID=UPI002DFE7920|nr:hypothetical protein [Actimicrobium sp. GrIS 1.19]